MNEINELISSYNEYLKNISPGSLQIAEHLRGNEVQEALKLILQFSEGMGWLLQVNDMFSSQNINTTLKIEKIHEFLNEINNGLEIQDYVLVADMFEYEIAPFFEETFEVRMIEQ